MFKHSIIGIDKIARWASGFLNITINEIFSGTGIQVARTNNPSSLVEPVEELEFYRNLMRFSDASIPFGLQAGYQLSMTTYGIWSLAVQSSLSLREGIYTGLRFLGATYTFNKIHFQERGNEGIIIVEPLSPLGDLQGFMLERDVAAIVRIVHDCLPHYPIKRIFLPNSVARNNRFEESLFRCPVVRTRSLAGVCFDGSLLDLPLSQNSALMREYCCKQLQEIMSERKMTLSSIRSRVESCIENMDLSHANMPDVAEKMCMSVRSLRRKLEQEGVSYKNIVDTYRRKMAAYYLEQRHLSLDQISEKLGYSDSASFSHAFKRWFNQAPRSIDFELYKNRSG